MQPPLTHVEVRVLGSLIEKAAKARERVTPPNHCTHCHKHHCRLLYIGCCICTGHITQDAPRPFSNKTKI
jgi:hypothetical protein